MGVLLAVVLIVSTSQAEPSRAVEYLMSNPVTMWDWGGYHLQNDIQKHLDQTQKALLTEIDGGAFVTLVYYPPANRLTIHTSISPYRWSKAILDEEMRKLSCIGLIHAVRRSQVLDASGKPVTGEPPHSLLYLTFGHDDFTPLTPRPDNFAVELDFMTEIKASVYSGMGARKVTHCSAPVREGAIAYEEEDY